MVAVPSLTAVTLPLASTVAIAVLELVQVTVLSVASSGFTVATRVSDSPSLSSRLVLFSVTSVTAMTFLLTVTEHVADFSPTLAVMVAEPSLTAVTLPLLSTVAIAVLELDQVTVLSVASSGLTVAVSVSDSPSVSVSSVLFNVTSVTVTVAAGFAACSTVKVLFIDPHLMVTEALRALSVSFGCAFTVMLTVPAPPELGSTVSQVATLVSATVALHDSVAVKVTVCVWGWFACCGDGDGNEIPLLNTTWLWVGIVISGCGCFGFSQEHITPTNSRRGIRFKRILNIIGYQSAMLLRGCLWQ